MKRILFLLAVSGVAALNAGALSSYKAITEKSAFIYTDDFSQGLKNWKVWCGRPVMKIVSGAGDNGSPGLVYERKKPTNTYDLLHYWFKGEPGKRYRVKVMYKLEGAYLGSDPKGKVTVQILNVVHFAQNRKKRTGSSASHVTVYGQKNFPWRELTLEFAVPAGTEESAVGLSLYRPNLAGKITFDNFSVEKMGVQEPVIYPVMTKQLTLSRDGRMEFRVFDYAGRNEKDLRLALSLNGKTYFAPVKNGLVSLKVQTPAPGKYPVKVSLLDEKARVIAGTLNYNFTVLKKELPPPGSVTLDRQGRVKIDGRNFLPIGMFATYPNINQKDLARLREGGFNCIMPYMSAKMSPGGAPQKSSQALKAGMDLLHKNNIKIMFCLTAQVKGGIRQFETASGSMKVAEYVCSKVCRHPALLGWYITDENQPGELPVARELRQRLSAIDPHHPVLTLTNKPVDHLVFGSTGDILMVDRYPIRGKESRSMSTIRDHFTSGIGKAKMGVWFVPQTFHWGAYQKPVTDFRFPTETEMRSMMLLAMNMGAKGYCFYSYSTIFDRQEKIFPGSAKKFWPQVVRVAKMLRELEEFFFTDDVSKVRCINKGKNFVEAKLYRSGKKVCVVITCDGPGKAEALLHIPGVTLKSRYGQTIRQKDGTYKFTGTDIGSDILTDF